MKIKKQMNRKKKFTRGARMRLKMGKGLAPRIQGHLRAAGQRRQAKRDARAAKT